MNVYALNSIRSHPLDEIDPPDIVNTVIEDRPILFRDQYGTLCTDPKRRGLFVKGEQAPPINIVKESYSFKSAQYGDLYNAMVSVCKKLYTRSAASSGSRRLRSSGSCVATPTGQRPVWQW